jgi:hypothetical protein
VERGNEERGGCLGHLTRAWSSRGLDEVGILRAPFYAFVVLDEAGVGLNECLPLSV